MAIGDEQATATATETRKGLAYALGAFFAWGFIAVYFKAVRHVAPLEVLAHRVVWSALLLWALLARSGRLGEVRAALADRRTRHALFGSTTLILGNWFLFIWAVEHDMLIEASLGFYVNPLVNVVLGAVVLGERLSRTQLAAVALAALGVAHHAAALGTFPLLGIGLALCFSGYGLVRKTVRVESAAGLTAETLLAAPLALGWLLYAGAQGELVLFDPDVAAAAGVTIATTAALLIAAGPVTAIPLLWFVHGARRLRYATIGFLQYLAPTLQFVVAVVVYDETLTTTHLVTFAVIWTALALYTADALRSARRRAVAAIARPAQGV